MSEVRRRKPPRVTPRPPPPDEVVPSHSKTWASLLCKLSLLVSVVCSCLLFYVYITSPVQAQAWPDEVKIIDYEGVFAINTKLTSGVKIPGIVGPESQVLDDEGNIYSSTKDGKIAKISPSSKGEVAKGRITFLRDETNIKGAAKANPNLETGWALGLRLLGNTLYYVDTQYGLCSIDVTSGEFHHLLGIDDVTPRMQAPDDLVIAKDGDTIYITDFSASNDMFNIMYIGLSGICDGRIIKYSISSGKAEVVKTGLCTPNSIELSQDGSRAFVTHTLRYKVGIYDVNTWQLIKNAHITGFADNIRATPRGTYWIAGQNKLSKDSINMALDKSPVLRQLIGGILSTQAFMDAQNHEFNALYEMSEEGEIIRVLFDEKGTLTYALTQGTELKDGSILLGSYIADFLAILNPL